MKNTIVLFVIVILTVNCKKDATPIQPVTTPVDFQNVPNAGGFRIPTKGTSVIRTDSAWSACWNSFWSITDGQGNKTAPPAVDFSKNMVVAIFYGYGTYTGCHDTVDVIQAINTNGSTITVTIGTLPSLGDCRAFVGPIQMVTIPQSQATVQFTGEIP